MRVITEQDIHDIVDFPKHYRVDCIAASFIRKASDIDNIRKVLGPELQHIQIIAKIENQEGLQNYEEILEKVDGIMVARGDPWYGDGAREGVPCPEVHAA